MPFLHILYILWAEVTQVLSFESERVRRLFGGLRFMLLTSWSFYPVVYMFSVFGPGGGTHLELIQLGNSAADLLAKVGVGLMTLAIAREKTEEDISAGRTTISLDAAAD